MKRKKKERVSFYMVENSFISVVLLLQEVKEENKGAVEFQLFNLTNKIL